ncbi:MAG: hypothetical protein ACI9FN_003202 [Saprospiraceae bacterium]|jgi:hypothetical protein
MKARSTSLFTTFSVILFVSALIFPLACALYSVEDSVMILSSMAEEEEGEAHDAKEDTEVKIASQLGPRQYEEGSLISASSFGYMQYSSTPYLKVVIPPPKQV